MKPLLKTKDVCRILNIPHSTLLELIKAGKIPYIRISQRVFRYDPDDIEQFKKERKLG